MENPVRACRGRAGREPRQLANSQVAGLSEAPFPKMSVNSCAWIMTLGRAVAIQPRRDNAAFLGKKFGGRVK